MLTTNEAAAALGISRGRVHHYISDGRLPATRFGNAYMISTADLAKVPKVRKPGPKQRRK